MRWHALLFFGLGACHASTHAAMSADSRIRNGPSYQAAEPGLSIAAEQLTDSRRVVIGIHLSNISSERHFWINGKPRIGHHGDYRRTEIEIAIIDARRREV